MNRVALVISVILITVSASLPLASEEPRFPDTARIVKLLSEIREYQMWKVPGSDDEVDEKQTVALASGIFIPAEHMAYGIFYKKAGDIDTVEEYCLAIFLPGKKAVSQKLQKALDEEFPRNAEGYLRMTALWYRIYSSDPNYNESAKDAIPFIINHGEKKGIAITEKSAREYYEKAVRNGLNKAFESELSKTKYKPDPASLAKITEPWYAYFTSPVDGNYAVLTMGRNCIDNNSKNKGKGGLLKGYDNAVLKFAGEEFYTQWLYKSDITYFYQEDIDRNCKEHFAGIPIFEK